MSASRLVQLLFVACALVSVVHGAGRGLNQVGSALGSGWPFSSFQVAAAAPKAAAAKAVAPLATGAIKGAALKQVSDPGTSAPCPSDSYRPAGSIYCVCNPGFGYRYSSQYCSKCPKGATQCDDDMYSQHNAA